MLERGPRSSAQLSLSFYHIRSREKVLGFFQPPDEKIFFERWVLSVRLVNQEGGAVPIHLPQARRLAANTASSPAPSFGDSRHSILPPPPAHVEQEPISTRWPARPAVTRSDVVFGVDAHYGLQTGLSTRDSLPALWGSSSVNQQSQGNQVVRRPPAAPSRSTEPPSLRSTHPKAAAGGSGGGSASPSPSKSDTATQGSASPPEDADQGRHRACGSTVRGDRMVEDEGASAIVARGDRIRELSRVETKEFERRISPLSLHSLFDRFSSVQGLVTFVSSSSGTLGDVHFGPCPAYDRNAESVSVFLSETSSVSNGYRERMKAQAALGGVASRGSDVFPQTQPQPERFGESDQVASQESSHTQEQGRDDRAHRDSEPEISEIRRRNPAGETPRSQPSLSTLFQRKGAEISSGRASEHGFHPSRQVYGTTSDLSGMRERCGDAGPSEAELGRAAQESDTTEEKPGKIRDSSSSASSWLLQEERAAQRRVERAVREAMLKIVRVTTEKQWHLPPPSHANDLNESLMYRFEINFSGPPVVPADHGWSLHFPAALRTAYSRHMPYLT
ncbi:hypothetical protein BESB_007530 [Besnoitia besnoiti]|uniref:Autophagy-related protein 101 n=1 Tax=Besnoitia besnoiti TaxID=94643 RepID=A0A2A9MP55_BESBE|nr:hypothetical protein BESB_007530 [Besnoitia besnoiti]PFH38411.1 hypothetical protein BESB_007530 [Besnoitia besnoiti]